MCVEFTSTRVPLHTSLSSRHAAASISAEPPPRYINPSTFLIVAQITFRKFHLADDIFLIHTPAPVPHSYSTTAISNRSPDRRARSFRFYIFIPCIGTIREPTVAYESISSPQIRRAGNSSRIAGGLSFAYVALDNIFETSSTELPSRVVQKKLPLFLLPLLMTALS